MRRRPIGTTEALSGTLQLSVALATQPFGAGVNQPYRGQPNFWTGQSPQFDPASNRFFPRPAVLMPQTFSRVPVAIGTPLDGDWSEANSFIAGGQLLSATQRIDSQLARNDSLGSYMSVVSAFQRAGAPVNDFQNYRQQALEMAREQALQGGNDPLPWVAVAKFSLEDQQEQQFREAVAALRARFPGDKHTDYFDGIEALKDGNFNAAERSFQLARQKGMPAQDIGQYLKLAIDGEKWIWEYAEIFALLLAAWVAELGLLFVVGRFLSNCVMRLIQYAERAEPSLGTRLLRSTYRVVVNFAGLYYYLSLPIVTLLAVALPLGVAYAVLMLPFISLPLVLMVVFVGIGGVLTATSGIRAAFVRVRSEPPGQALEETAAPRFWVLLCEIAAKVGTRPSDEVWLTPDATVEVVERGGYLRCWRDRGRRALILGIGVLEGFRHDAFCAVIAHEYGHFLNRDTAGGDVALRVINAMDDFALRIMRRGRVRPWDVAMQFLRLYHYLFRRLSFGASRLQEVLADRVAGSIEMAVLDAFSVRGNLLRSIRPTQAKRGYKFVRFRPVVGEATITG